MMGTAIPDLLVVDPVVPGPACALCWGPGKPFGDGDSPASVFLSVSGINKGPMWDPFYGEPPSGDFELFSVVPCFYTLQFDNTFMFVQWLGSATQISIVLLEPLDIFIGITTELCETFLLNTVTEEFVGGSCRITIPDVE